MIPVNTVICGDAFSVLKRLPSESVDMCCTSPPYHALRSYLPDSHPDKALEIGTESSYDEYVTRLCDVFDEVKRVLKPQGSIWVVIGDQYSGSGGTLPSPYQSKARKYGYVLPKRPKSDIPKKSLCLIPFRFAIEMVRRGWICRNVLIWRKPNSLPSTATDRYTVDFEYLFFFVKSQHYYFHQQLEPAVYEKGMRNMRAVWTGSKQLYRLRHDLSQKQRNYVTSELLRRGGL